MAGETIGLTIGRKDFVAETNAWSEAQIAAAERLPSLLEERGIKTVSVTYYDTHGQMRAKSLTAQHFRLALRNGVAETVGPLYIDTTNNVVLPIFSRDGGFGLEQMGGYVLQHQAEDNWLIELKRINLIDADHAQGNISFFP